jgi:hypothetical protein
MGDIWHNTKTISICLVFQCESFSSQRRYCLLPSRYSPCTYTLVAPAVLSLLQSEHDSYTSVRTHARAHTHTHNIYIHPWCSMSLKNCLTKSGQGYFIYLVQFFTALSRSWVCHFVVFVHGAITKKCKCVGLCENQITLISLNKICLLHHVLIFYIALTC